ncbi:MAG: DUF1003 domain-containing protein [Patescibacteria group bacterium]|nr:DUF1003 domain-containing protein [Patescibacteria group bacterium]
MAEDLREDLYLKHRPKNVNVVHEKMLGFQDRVALVITTGIGTMYAVYFFGVFMTGWMIWQSTLSKPFDPYPFAFLLFLGNIIQLLLMPLIMVGQNIQGRHAELRAEEEFKTTESIYQGIEQILSRLEEQEKKIQCQSELIEKLTKN